MVKKSLYPLKFGPIPGERVWGGDYLKKKLFQDSENSLPIGESLDLCGLEGESTAVVNGFLAGNTIDEVIETYLGDVVGDDKYDRFGNLLPIIVKRLDVKDYLSIQVHPDNLTAMERYESYGKNEMWYIMDADPDAVLYLGGFPQKTPEPVPEAKRKELRRYADFLEQYMGMDEEAFNEEIDTQVKEYVKQQEVLDLIAGEENITVSDDEIDEWVEQNAQAQQMTADELKEQYSEDELKEQALNEKVISWLWDEAKVTSESSDNE